MRDDMMKIVCCPDSFKESMRAEEAGRAMERGFRKVLGDGCEVEVCPLADGGEGTVDAMVLACDGEVRVSKVCGPRGEEVDAKWGMIVREGKKIAVIEMAEAAGLGLVAIEKRDASKMTTYGVGELLLAAASEGAEEVVMGIGGSASHDGGCGMARAIGIRFSDCEGREIEGRMSGEKLKGIGRIDVSGVDEGVAKMKVRVACDVVNPLTGEDGAARVYGPQKGAGEEMVKELDEGLVHLAEVLRRDVGKDIEWLKGAGAAGGLGGGCVAFLDASLTSGIKLVMDSVGFEARIKDADWVITGEGKIDGQSAKGKVVAGVIEAVKREGAGKVWAMVGQVGDGVEDVVDLGLDGYTEISEGVDMGRAMREGEELMVKACERLAREKMVV